MKTVVVTKEYDKKLLSNFLFYSFPNLNKNTFFKALRKKDIRINDVKINKDVVVNYNDVIKLYIIDELLYKTFIPDIVYEDENILVINKPSDLAVVGDNSLTSNLKNYFSNQTNNTSYFLEPCHRLDRNTTGLILFAKNETALNILFDKFKSHEIEKHYLAKVYGIPKLSTQTIISYLFKDSKNSRVYISDEAQKGYTKIITTYSVVEKNIEQNFSILDITLHTGKTHQIRAHLAHIGLPIIGDGKYGNNKINKQFSCKTQQLCSYCLKFNFSNDAGILNYLNNKIIKMKTQCNF